MASTIDLTIPVQVRLDKKALNGLNLEQSMNDAIIKALTPAVIDEAAESYIREFLDNDGFSEILDNKNPIGKIMEKKLVSMIMEDLDRALASPKIRRYLTAHVESCVDCFLDNSDMDDAACKVVTERVLKVLPRAVEEHQDLILSTIADRMEDTVAEALDRDNRFNGAVKKAMLAAMESLSVSSSSHSSSPSRSR